MVKLLIVDDAQFNRRLVRKMLKPTSYEIEEAATADEALMLIEQNPPDLMLLDLMMPGMNGMELLARLQERQMKLPTVVLTADIQNETRDKCLALGAKAYLNKPVDGELLRQTLAQALNS